MSKYYIPLKELPEYCCKCPCSGEGSEYNLDTGKEMYVYQKCYVTGEIVSTCDVDELFPEWNKFKRPKTCPIKEFR